jgi:peptidylprolyl isomerase
MFLRVSLVALGLSLFVSVGAFADNDSDWRAVDPENIIYIETESGRAVFELNPDFAPNHVKRVKDLIRDKHYDGAPAYRVIDGFVVQFGPGIEGEEGIPTLKAEFSHSINPEAPFVLAQEPEFFTPQTGFIKGFPVGRDPSRNLEYLVNCRGTINFSRGGADDAVAHLAIMTGQAPRHLDNNTSQFGRALMGMEHLIKFRLGDEANGGVIESPEDMDHFTSIRIAADLPEEDQTKLMVMKTDTEAFRKVIEGQRHRDRDSWFINSTASVVDVCYTKVPVKLAK